MGTLSYIYDDGPTAAELTKLLKVLVWANFRFTDPLEDVARVVIPGQLLDFDQDLDVALVHLQDPRGLEIKVTNRTGRVNRVLEKLATAFKDEVPSPDLVRDAYKKLTGVDL